METTAPDVTIDTTIGQVIVPSTPTATPTVTATATSTSASSATSLPTATATATATTTARPYVIPIPPLRRFRSPTLSIYGYGPAEAEVSLVGIGVSERVVSQENGFFRFDSIYSYSHFYPELCLQAIDSEKRVTQPSCIPALPLDSSVPLEVGPILLSPTISLDKNNVVVGDTSLVTGFSIPDSEVNVFIAKDQGSSLSLVNTVNAYYIPTFVVQSKSDGSYEFSLPSSDATTYKLFASGRIGEDLTAKSTTLTYSVISEVESGLWNLKEFLLRNRIWLLIILELLVIMILGIKVLKEPTRRKKGNKKIISRYLKTGV